MTHSCSPGQSYLDSLWESCRVLSRARQELGQEQEADFATLSGLFVSLFCFV